MPPDLKAAIAILAIVIFFIIMDQIGVALNRMVKKYEVPDWPRDEVGWDEYHGHIAAGNGPKPLSQRVALQYNKFYQAATRLDSRFGSYWLLADEAMNDFQAGHMTERELEVYFDALELQVNNLIEEKRHVS